MRELNGMDTLEVRFKNNKTKPPASPSPDPYSLSSFLPPADPPLPFLSSPSSSSLLPYLCVGLYTDQARALPLGYMPALVLSVQGFTM